MKTVSRQKGIIIKISGPVLDVRFENELPQIHDLLVTQDGKHMEVAAHIAPAVVRCIALDATDGLWRLAVPAPEAESRYGRVISAGQRRGRSGRPIDDFGADRQLERWAIHREAPVLPALSG
jgi:F-type H+-transporting ATPase subunit beta